MMRLIVAAFIAVALFAATTLLRSHSISDNEAARTAMMPGVQEMQHATDTGRLPAEDFEDRPLVYPNRPLRRMLLERLHGGRLCCFPRRRRRRCRSGVTHRRLAFAIGPRVGVRGAARLPGRRLAAAEAPGP